LLNGLEFCSFLGLCSPLSIGCGLVGHWDLRAGFDELLASVSLAVGIIARLGL
jgi:hypothetical protein